MSLFFFSKFELPNRGCGLSTGAAYTRNFTVLIFDGDENKYELWEVKFLGYARLQKLYNVFVPAADEREAPTAAKNAEAFAELGQCLDDRSLALVIREAKDDGRRALQVLREHYQGKGKPHIIAPYTELTSLEMKEGESTTDYILRAEKAATALKAANFLKNFSGLTSGMGKCKGEPVRIHMDRQACGTTASSYPLPCQKAGGREATTT